MDKFNKYFKTDERNNYMSSFSNKSELGNDHINNSEDYIYKLYRNPIQNQNMEKSQISTNKKPIKLMPHYCFLLFMINYGMNLRLL